MTDCHYRRDRKPAQTGTTVSISSSGILDSNPATLPDGQTGSGPVLALAPGPDENPVSKADHRTDSVYILPKVTFVNINGTDVPVLDEAIAKMWLPTLTTTTAATTTTATTATTAMTTMMTTSTMATIPTTTMTSTKSKSESTPALSESKIVTDV